MTSSEGRKMSSGLVIVGFLALFMLAILFRERVGLNSYTPSDAPFKSDISTGTPSDISYNKNNEDIRISEDGRPETQEEWTPLTDPTVETEQEAPTVSEKTPTKGYCHNDSQSTKCCKPEQCHLVQQSSLFSSCCNNVSPKDVETGKTTTYPLLITATPRSGTVFSQTLLNKLGVPVANDWQNPTKNGMVSWMHVRKDAIYFGPARLFDRKFVTMWHQVRDPLKSLTSMAFTEPLGEENEYSLKYVHFINRHIHLTAKGTALKAYIEPKFQPDSTSPKSPEEQLHERFLIFRGLEFYMEWHTFIMSLRIPRLRLEDLVEHYDTTVLDEVFTSAGWPKPNHDTAIQFIKSDRRKRQLRRKLHTNARKHRPTLEWHELCRVDVEMTEEFLELCHDFGYYLDLEVEDVCSA